ncbi:uncharacterized protein EI90DRAFT_3031787 [Cantharellus anzutake]|uniref:uncharacterized protein n=1 Tax=Cantharellus anzutake TaxID=1750568 RepID=UPI0019060283|nr:uncharacterized protein EI90DRAFT_3031787 [Cantharellus anzutake]KAF8341993.1 hypothetical protein EI90DRAFT_3031787 [Cantharellus anzutake]
MHSYVLLLCFLHTTQYSMLQTTSFSTPITYVHTHTYLKMESFIIIPNATHHEWARNEIWPTPLG